MAQVKRRRNELSLNVRPIAVAAAPAEAKTRSKI